MTAKFPDEVPVPLLKSSREVNDTKYGGEVVEGPTSSLEVESCLFKEFRLQRKQTSASTHELWIRRLPSLVPTVMYSKNGHAVRVRMTNIATKSASYQNYYPIILWQPHEVLPRDDVYVRINTAKYHDRQLLAYKNAMDGKL